MMDLVFKAGVDLVSVRILNKTVFFMKYQNGIPFFQDLSKINFSIDGLLKTYPDLKGKEDKEIREEGSKRLKEHIKNMNTEEEVKDYVILELEKLGCVLMSIIKPGHRPIYIKKNIKNFGDLSDGGGK